MRGTRFGYRCMSKGKEIWCWHENHEPFYDEDEIISKLTGARVRDCDGDFWLSELAQLV